MTFEGLTSGIRIREFQTSRYIITGYKLMPPCDGGGGEACMTLDLWASIGLDWGLVHRYITFRR